MGEAGDIVYTRRPLSPRAVIVASLMTVFGAWLLMQGLTAYAHKTDAEAMQQFRAVKSILAGGVFFVIGLLLAYAAIAGVLRDLPRLTLSKNNMELQGIFKTVTIGWGELGPCALNPKATFIRSAITSTNATSGVKIPIPIIIAGMKGDMAALADDLNHRIAAARGEDYAKIAAAVAAVQEKDKVTDDRRRYLVKRGLIRVFLMLVIFAVLLVGGMIARVHFGLPHRPYDSFILIGSILAAFGGSTLIAKKKYPDLPKSELKQGQ